MILSVVQVETNCDLGRLSYMKHFSKHQYQSASPLDTCIESLRHVSVLSQIYGCARQHNLFEPPGRTNRNIRDFT